MQTQELLHKFLINGASSKEMNVAADVFDYTTPSDRVTKIEEVVFLISDAAITADTFGGLVALATGLLIQARNNDGSLLKDFLDGATVKTNHELSGLAPLNLVGGAAVDSLTVRWIPAKPLVLNAGQKFAVETQDNLAGLASFNVLIKGCSIDIGL